MKKMNQMALIVSTGIIGIMLSAGSANAQAKPKGKPWNAPESSAKAKSPAKSDESTIKDGKAIYTQHCKSCHGVKGVGDGDKAKKIEISCGDFTSQDFKNDSEGTDYWKITEGRKPMPSFKDKLTDQERWKVVAYIRSL